MTAGLLAVALFGAMVMLGVGMVLGFLFARRPVGASSRKYICDTCSDGFGMHDPQTGACHATQGKEWDYSRAEYKHIRCTCRQYVGERPPPTYEELTRPPELPKELP